ncbi:MAG: phage integrase SAM-like domain-containing protein [Bacteroidaceae bacterium]|nr:phage integrase SAM-like domain-containing protein [Bacteroidaceae bacterium]
MLTIRAEIKKSEQRSDKTYNVKLRFTLDRKVKRVSTSLFVTAKDLTKDLKIKPSSPIKKEVDALVRVYQERCAKLQIELNDYTVDDIVDMLNGEQAKSQKIDFIKFCREWIANAEIKGAPNYTTAVNALVRFVGKEELDVKLITTEFLERFKEFLSKEREERARKLALQGKRLPSNRAQSLYLMSIKKLFKEAKKFYNKKYKNTILISHSPFEDLTIPRQEATRKRAISAELIREIWKLPYKNIKKGYRNTCLFDMAKDCFILSFGLIGMNSADLYYATDYQDGIITYYRTKTKARRLDKGKMQVVVPKMLLPLVEKYRDQTGERIFNFYHLYANEKALSKALNRGLKEIGALLNIDDLEYYAARHSWATIAVNKVGIDKYTVHAALNHLDESMKVTDIYIERDFAIENRANAKVMEYVFNR